MPYSASETSAIAALADRIARDLQSGAIAPGLWLKQIDLETRYQASRPAIRRALDQLVQNRLVRHIPNRGYYAFEPDDQTTAEITAIRIVLETATAEPIIAHANSSDIAALDHHAKQFEALIHTGTLMELSDANLAFHRTLHALCGNAELVKLIQSLHQRTSAAPVGQWHTIAHIEASAAEHHAMVAAIAHRDVAQLRETITRHILQAERKMPSKLQSP